MAFQPCVVFSFYPNAMEWWSDAGTVFALTECVPDSPVFFVILRRILYIMYGSSVYTFWGIVFWTAYYGKYQRARILKVYYREAFKLFLLYVFICTIFHQLPI